MNGTSRRMLLGWAAYVLAPLVALGAEASLPAAASDQSQSAVPFYVGTYTSHPTAKGGKSKGIYLCRLDRGAGKLLPAVLAGESVDPSFIVVHPSGGYLYAANEINRFEGQPTASVSAFAIDPASGMLKLLDWKSAHGQGACHVSVDHSGKWVLVADYNSGSIACLPIQAGGGLGEATSAVQHPQSAPGAPRRQAPLAHWINVDPANRFVLAVDKGLDKIMSYRFDAAQGVLSANDPPYTELPSGAGPRHLAFHPNGRYAYVINELNSTVTACAYDAQRGSLTPIKSVSTLPTGYAGGNTTAEVQVHPSGKFLYGSNRGHNSIVAMAIEADGTLRVIGWQPTEGKTPRGFSIDPSGEYLIVGNQDSDNLVLLRIDAETGKLSPTGSSLQLTAPVCIEFPPSAKK
jgi:6-phosphogluconolactonase